MHYSLDLKLLPKLFHCGFLPFAHFQVNQINGNGDGGTDRVGNADTQYSEAGQL